MRLRSLPPSEALKEIVMCYLLFETETDFPDWQTNTQMPAGVTAIGFSYGGVTNYKTAKGPEKRIPHAAIVGQHDIPYIISHKSFRKELLVIFKPLGLYQVLRCNISELSNDLLCTSLLGLPGTAEIPERLSQASGPWERIGIVESWLLKRLARTYSKTPLTDFYRATGPAAEAVFGHRPAKLPQPIMPRQCQGIHAGVGLPGRILRPVAPYQAH